MGFCPASQLDLTAGSIVTGHLRALYQRLEAPKFRYMIHPPEPLSDILANELIYAYGPNAGQAFLHLFCLGCWRGWVFLFLTYAYAYGHIA